jgi:acyl transferase domain-containing protein
VGLGALWRGERRRRVPLPTYPFERTRHWIDAEPEPAGAPEPWDVRARTNGNGHGAEMPLAASAVVGARRIP